MDRGGVCWIHLRNKARFDLHFGWIAAYFAYGEGLDRASEEDVGYLPLVVLAAYGDRAYGIDLKNFIDFIHELADLSAVWMTKDGHNLYDLTFEEAFSYLAMNTPSDPASWEYADRFFRDLVDHVCHFSSLQIPDHLRLFTLREWGHLGSLCFDPYSYSERETWRGNLD